MGKKKAKKSPPPVPDPDSLPPGTPYVRYVRDSGGRAQEKSVRDQIAEIANEAETKRGWICIDTFSDEAKSGTDPGRAGLNRFLAYTDQRDRAPVVAIWAYSRFAREPSIAFDILSHTRRAGMAIHSVSDPVPHAYRAIMEPLYLWQASEQSEKNRGRYQAGFGANDRRWLRPWWVSPHRICARVCRGR